MLGHSEDRDGRQRLPHPGAPRPRTSGRGELL